MRVNIYIRKENEKAWDDLPNKSESVNNWLTNKAGSVGTIKHVKVEKENDLTKSGELFFTKPAETAAEKANREITEETRRRMGL